MHIHPVEASQIQRSNTFKVTHAEALTQTSNAMSEHPELSPLEVKRPAAESLELSRVSEFFLQSPTASGLSLPSPFFISARKSRLASLLSLVGMRKEYFVWWIFTFGKEACRCLGSENQLRVCLNCSTVCTGIPGGSFPQLL